MSTFLDEAKLELALLDMLREMGYGYVHGPEIGHEAERAGYDQVVLVGRLTGALEAINLRVPAEGIDDAVRQVTRTESASLVENNKRFHQMLTEDELPFYDAVEVNDSAVKVLGDDTLGAIARELVQAVRRNATIDWSVKASVRARLRVIVKRILRRHRYDRMFHADRSHSHV